MNSEIRLTIEIRNKRPVELADLAKSMIALADEYRGFLSTLEADIKADEIKLYVKEIRPGSIIQELVAMAPFALPLFEYTKTVIDFTTHLKDLYEWYKGEGSTKPEDTDKSSLQNLSNIIDPVAKDNGSQINIGALYINGNPTVTFGMSSVEANAVQNAIRKELDSRKEPITGIYEQVVMYWAQARNNTNNKSGDKARIESIFDGDVKVRFATELLKKQMLHDEPFPFKKAFVVDVAVETIQDKPVLYKVLRLHEALDLDS